MLMDKTTTNILVVLGILTVCFGAYYLFTTTDTIFSFSDSRSDSELSAMRSRTDVFIERRQILSQIEYDFSIFESQTFNNLESFRTQIQPQPIGRPNPFDEAEEAVGVLPAPETEIEEELTS